MTSLEKAFWCFLAAAALGPAPRATGADFAPIRSFVEAHCLDCHSTRARKGGLDLERFGTPEEVSADIESWQAVLEMLETDQMPPRRKPRPPAAERRLVIAWIHGLLDREARLRAGDPGPLPVRRLNNAEYRYTIRDLTGVDLRPARQFPDDGAAGEGFLNATEALAISPDLVAKYLDAAKEIAAHAVLLPDGFRFSTSRFREDWVNEVLAEILALYANYTTDLGEIPLARYLQATVAHRDTLRSDADAFGRVATADGLSPRYLRSLWQALDDDGPSLLLDGIRTRWRSATADNVSSLAAEIFTLQGVLWHKREPQGEHALDDRYVPADVELTARHTYRLAMSKDGAEAVFYLVAQTLTGHAEEVRVVLERPRFEAEGKEPVPLRDALESAAGATEPKSPGERAALPDGVDRLDLSRFAGGARKEPPGSRDLVLGGSEALEVRLPRAIVAGRTFVVEARLDPLSAPGALARLHVQKTPALPRVERGLRWEYREPPAGRAVLAVRTDDEFRRQVAAAADAFRGLFPARVCYPGVIVRDSTVTLERFHRGDRFLSALLLDRSERERLDRLWEELHYISGDALQVWNSLSTLTQGELKAYEQVKNEVDRRARQAEGNLLASEPRHLEALLELTARAYRRPLTADDQRSLRDLYAALRKDELSHDEAFRAVLARLLVSPGFLYRIERPSRGTAPAPVSGPELATRLSYFLWSSMPDEELRRVADAGRLHDPETLAHQTRRLLRDPRSRALAIEFGTQWLEVRAFDRFEGKNQELFPDFDAPLRRAMYEESILFFEDLFRNDRPLSKLIDSDHTFVNERLAAHYGIPGIRGDAFRRVGGVKNHGRGGLLALASVLAKHSGASRTSPVLRGNWIAETLLGERLPRPPDDVPKLPDGEAEGSLTIRQLVEKHAREEQCAVCHERIDPLGFALEQYDTIGRRRRTDLGGRPVDATARLASGAVFDGLDGLREYLLGDRRADLVRQFCRKLLGYALGRRVLLSDRQLLDEMAAALEKEDGRPSAVILRVVQSKQFRFIRGLEPRQRKRI